MKLSNKKQKNNTACRKFLRNGTLAASAAVGVTAWMLPNSAFGASATFSSNTSGASWTSTGNWTGAVIAGVTGNTANTDVASFTTAGTTIGINMNTAGGSFSLGAINDSRAGAITIINSTTVASGVLRLFGGAVSTGAASNVVTSNVIVRNANTGLLTLPANSGTNSALGLVLSNTTENKIFVDNTGGITISANITGATNSGPLSIQGAGSGVVTLSGTNTYAGGTTVNGASLTVSTASSIGSGDINIAGGTLTSTGNISLGATGGAATVSGGTLTLNSSGAGSLTLGSSKNFSMSSGSWNLSLASGSLDTIVSSGGSSTFSITGGNIALSGATAGVYQVFTGFSGGTATSGFTFSGLNGLAASFDSTGALTLSVAGDFWVGNDAVLGGDGIWQQTGGTAWASTNNNVAGGPWDQTGTVTAIFGGSVATSAVSVSGTVVAGNGVHFTSNGYTLTGGTISLAGNTAAINSITTDGAATVINSVLDGTHGFTKDGVGTLTISGTNTVIGSVDIKAGTLILAAAGAMNSGMNVGFSTAAGDLQLGGQSVTIGSLTSTSAVPVVENANANPGALTVTVGGTTFAGILRDGVGGGKLGLSLNGSGTLVLSGTKSYTGDTSVTTGTLSVTTSGITGGGALAVNSGSFTQDSASTSTFGAVTLVSGAISGGTISAASYTASAGTISSTLQGTNATFSKISAGDVTLGALGIINTFAGGVSIDAGNLILANSGAINSANTLSMTNTGKISLNGVSSTFSDISSSSTGTVIQNNSTTSASVLTVNKTTGNSTFKGTIQDGTVVGASTLALAKSGSGSLELTGTNSYSGGTSITGGTLKVSNSAGLGSAAVNINNGNLYVSGGVANASNNVTNNIIVAAQPLLISGYDFTGIAASPNTPTSYSASVGSGTLSLDGTFSNSNNSWIQASELNAFGGTAANTSGTALSTVTTGTSALALVGGGTGTNQTANGKFIVFTLNMTGQKNLVVTYETQRTGTGFTSQTWAYSTDGINWSTPTAADTIGATSAIPTTFGLETVNDLTALNNAGIVYLRMTVAGATAATGNNRLDNFQFNVDGSSVPVLGSTDTSGTQTFSGSVTLNNNAALNAEAGGTVVFSGQIAGGSNVNKTGGGVVTLSNANNTYSGTTSVNAGTLLVNGTLSSGGGAVMVNSGGTLGGSGTISRAVDVKSSGTLAPGSTPAQLTVGSVNLESGSSYSVVLAGTAAGTGYTQLVVSDPNSGTVSLDGSNLVLSLSFDSQVGDKFTLIDNDQADSILGNFAQGSTITTVFGSNTYQFGINYGGGDGNELVLTTLTPEPTSLTLLGLGAMGLLSRRKRRRKA